jgi:Predicted transmembrane sensor domain
MVAIKRKPPERSLKARVGVRLARVRKELFSKKALRRLIAVVSVLILTWFFGKAGVLEKLDRIVSDVQSRVNPVPTDGKVALVEIDDTDYWQLFGRSPLPADKLFDLINTIARGGPSVIAIDIDTSAHSFAEFKNNLQCSCAIVFEREVEEIPDKVEPGEQLKLLPLLGGRNDLGAAHVSSGIPILIDDPEDGTTRRYQRYFATEYGSFPAFTTAIVNAYAKESNNAQLAAQVATPNQQEMLIRFSGDRQGSHRIRLTASKLLELAKDWPADDTGPKNDQPASPLQGRIVLLGGSYLGQDQHKTPVGWINGVEVLANVIETELSGKVAKAPGSTVSYIIDLFEAFGLILLFHFRPFRRAVLESLLLIPVVAFAISFYAYGGIAYFGHFVVVLLGLLCFELWEHFRREQFPHMMKHVERGHHT